MSKIEIIKRYFDAGEYVATVDLEELYKAYSDLIVASRAFGESASMSHDWAIRQSFPVLDMLRARNTKGY
jgi:arginine decarboxylase-like protein